MENEHWKVIPEQTADHWLQVQDPDGWYGAYVKWDGCIGFDRHFNYAIGEPHEPNDANVDSIHICDIDDFIARLQSLKAAALAHFGESWPR